MIDNAALLGASHATQLMANRKCHAPLTDNPISCLKTRNDDEGAAINGVIVKYETSPKQILEQWPTDRHMQVCVCVVCVCAGRVQAKRIQRSTCNFRLSVFPLLAVRFSF